MNIIKNTLLALSVAAVSHTAMAATTGATVATVDPDADLIALQEICTNEEWALLAEWF